MKKNDDAWYWELLEEQHEHDVVMIESRKEDGNELLRGEESADN